MYNFRRVLLKKKKVISTAAGSDGHVDMNNKVFILIALSKGSILREMTGKHIEYIRSALPEELCLTLLFYTLFFQTISTLGEHS